MMSPEEGFLVNARLAFSPPPVGSKPPNSLLNYDWMKIIGVLTVSLPACYRSYLTCIVCFKYPCYCHMITLCSGSPLTTESHHNFLAFIGPNPWGSCLSGQYPEISPPLSIKLWSSHLQRHLVPISKRRDYESKHLLMYIYCVPKEAMENPSWVLDGWAPDLSSPQHPSLCMVILANPQRSKPGPSENRVRRDLRPHSSLVVQKKLSLEVVPEDYPVP